MLVKLRQKATGLSRKGFVGLLSLAYVATCVFAAVPKTQAAPPIRINAGGSAYTDPEGRAWAADNSYNTGFTNSTSAPIAGTTADPLYQTERWDYQDATPLRYSVPVSNGIYQVRLHFAEIYGFTAAPGARVFDVSLENSTVLDDLDIYKEVGANTALVKNFTTTVSDGQLTIGFAHGSSNNPKIAAIEAVKQISSDSWPEYSQYGGKKVDMMVVGDSYTAGNGASTDGSTGYFFRSADDPRLDGQIRQSAPTEPLSRGCFRHHNTWGEQAYHASRQQYGNRGAFVNVACSGDTTDNLTGANGAPSQLDGFDTARRADMDVIALTIGGNDLGFSNLIAQCFVIRSGNDCHTALTIAELRIAPPMNGQNSYIMQRTLAVLNKLKTDWPNAKIVLVGYPVIWQDKTTTLTCTNCAGGVINPGQRLETGVDALTIQQKQLVDTLNVSSPNRFGHMALHKSDNTGFYDGHGLHGTKEPWIHSLSTSPSVYEWFHPNLAGYTAIGNNLLQQPFVQQLFQ